MSLLLLDLGNTRLKLARHGTRGPEHPRALAHADPRFAAALEDTLAAWPGARTALRASVAAPALTASVDAALAARGVAVTPVRVAEHPSLRLCYAEPARFGVDRWLALLGARQLAPGQPLLLVACGTALTVDLVAADGRHLGGAIAPSPELMLAALRGRAPHLPDAAPLAPGLACDTAAALAAGCAGAALGLIARSLEHASRVLGTVPRLLLTGGGAPALLPLLPAGPGAPPSYHAWLVLDGLAVLARDGASPG